MLNQNDPYKEGFTVYYLQYYIYCLNKLEDIKGSKYFKMTSFIDDQWEMFVNQYSLC